MNLNEVLRGDELLVRYHTRRYTSGANPKAKICYNFDHRRLRTYSYPPISRHIHTASLHVIVYCFMSSTFPSSRLSSMPSSASKLIYKRKISYIYVIDLRNTNRFLRPFLGGSASTGLEPRLISP